MLRSHLRHIRRDFVQEAQQLLHLAAGANLRAGDFLRVRAPQPAFLGGYVGVGLVLGRLAPLLLARRPRHAGRSWRIVCQTAL